MPGSTTIKTTVIAAALAGLATGAAASAAPGQVAEIIVTAQKRQQRLQDVPIVVNVVSAAQLRNAGAMDIKDLQILVPGLTVTSTTTTASTTARIRGVGTVGDNAGLESSVGVVIDGVYRPRNGVGFTDLGELDRIEVLKGPQGTLFGKSTSAGVINVLTAEPSFTFGAKAEVTASNFNGWGGSASSTGPVDGDKVAGRLFVAARRRDGFQSVSTGAGPRTDKQDDNQNYWTTRGQLLFTPNADVRLRLVGDYTRRDEACCAAVQIAVGSSPTSRAALVNLVAPNSVPMAPDPSARVAYANRSSANVVVDEGLSAQFDAKLGGADFTSVTGLRRWINNRGSDWDFTAADLIYRPNGQAKDKFDTFSEEARLSGKSGALNWLGGAFFAKESYVGAAPLIYGSDYYAYLAGKVLSGAPGLIGALPGNTFVPGSGQRDSFNQTDTNWAIFTNDTLNLTSAWDVTLGLRYTSDKKALTSVFATTSGSCNTALAAYPTLVGAVGAPKARAIVGGLCLPWETQAYDGLSGKQSSDEKQWSGTIKTSYRLSPDVMTYASYARGYKAGGFNFDRPSANLTFTPSTATLTISPTTRFRPETVDAFELGAKTQSFNGRVTLNVALFDQTYHDFQLNTFLGTSFIVESIPTVTSRGVDADLAWRTPVEGLNLMGGVTYAQTRYGAFTAADLTDPTHFAGLSRLPGAAVSFAPLWSGSITGSYERPLAGGSLVGRASLSAKYNSNYNTGSDLAPQKSQTAYTLVNARISIGGSSKRWTAEAWAMNLTDVTYMQTAFNGPLQGSEADPANIRTYDAFLGQPRTFGLTLRVSY